MFAGYLKYVSQFILYKLVWRIPAFWLFLLLVSCQVVSMWPLGQQHARLLCPPLSPRWSPCPSPTPKVSQTHVLWVGDAIQPSYPLSSPSPVLSLSQCHGLFQWVGSLHQVAKVLKLQLHLPVNIQGWFSLGLTGLISRKCFCKWFFKKMFLFIFGCAESSLLFLGFV